MLSRRLGSLCPTRYKFVLHSFSHVLAPRPKDHRRMASQIHTLSFSHATESPFHTSIGHKKLPDEKIYTAKQIADFVLSVKDLTPDEVKQAQTLARKHGILDHRPVQNDVGDFDEIYSSGCILAIAHFYNKLADLKFKQADICETYEKCVRAVNSLTYLLQTPLDKTSRLPGPVKLSRGERWKLDRVWDISVCLLGAIKARCGFQRGFRVGDIPIVHDVHYRRAAKLALDRNNLHGRGRICQKALRLLTREDIEPFIQPYHLIEELGFSADIDDQNVTLDHRNCTEDSCEYDTDVKHKPPKEYHVLGCKECEKRKPPADSKDNFESIAMNGMPAVNVSRGCGPEEMWWVKADHRTLVVSHVWRDGIWGTRDDGIRTCAHNLLSKIARDNNCDSYWIDCATIPEEPDTRKNMIMRINKTFRDAGLVLCWDKKSATLGPEYAPMLLSLVVSAWHRRAWTLLEGNRGQLSRINFLRWTGKEETPYELFNLETALRSVFDNESNVPLWIRSTFVELLPYSGAALPMDAAGLLLSGRHASRTEDSQAIWGLLRPVEGNDKTDDFQYDDPYIYAKDGVDVAFISSNAERFRRNEATQSWRPGKTAVNVWARTAYGGIKATITGEKNGRRDLEGTWWAKEGEKWKQSVDWTKYKDVERIKRIEREEFEGFALICPILMGDPLSVPDGKHSSAPVSGFFRTNLVMECDRAIIITKRRGDEVWQWQGLVDMKKGKPLLFNTSETNEFVIGDSRLH
ncbi:uncharacterized protein F4807DRAFT_444589 [Annulohypoxylon truncatum]|uniref:uncharacterized protein n=1 Tax=Annulohypoxylon truncatum TaxID=327061 RepID=UPI002008674D|nr:uncharacterized protein F4807DRAFT_444589 [Annulohypoxylon truncatum]KAI1204978.1 hypothetical protein F4807DRAFT_444589 [Annulohypoxylon truncatum]